MNKLRAGDPLPRYWRQALWKPLVKPHKDPALVRSYRPISLLCAAFKLYERLLLRELHLHYPNLPSNQFGFAKN